MDSHESLKENVKMYKDHEDQYLSREVMVDTMEIELHWVFYEKDSDSWESAWNEFMSVVTGK